METIPIATLRRNIYLTTDQIIDQIYFDDCDVDMNLTESERMDPVSKCQKHEHVCSALASKHHLISWVILIQLDESICNYAQCSQVLVFGCKFSLADSRFTMCALCNHCKDHHAYIILIRWLILLSHLCFLCSSGRHDKTFFNPQ